MYVSNFEFMNVEYVHQFNLYKHYEGKNNTTYILLVGWIEKLIRVANPTNPKYMSWVENVSQPNLTKPVYTPTHFLDLIRVTFF